jgi:hypothetical protein
VGNKKYRKGPSFWGEQVAADLLCFGPFLLLLLYSPGFFFFFFLLFTPMASLPLFTSWASEIKTDIISQKEKMNGITTKVEEVLTNGTNGTNGTDVKPSKANIGVYTNPAHDLWVAEAEPSLETVQNGGDLKDGEVLLNVKSTGICGSDIHFWHAVCSSTLRKLPIYG